MVTERLTEADLESRSSEIVEGIRYQGSADDRGTTPAHAIL
jgi:hypothetical protein